VILRGRHAVVKSERAGRRRSRDADPCVPPGGLLDFAEFPCQISWRGRSGAVALHPRNLPLCPG